MLAKQLLSPSLRIQMTECAIHAILSDILRWELVVVMSDQFQWDCVVHEISILGCPFTVVSYEAAQILSLRFRHTGV